ncbi:MAG: hypothetical protein ACYC9S_10700 [Leptospirales bacterium]
MERNRPETAGANRFPVSLFLSLFLLVLAGCVPRPSLQFSPSSDPAMEKKIRQTGEIRLGVVTFSDDRIVARGAGDPHLIGWGTGTGTLDTLDNIKRFVTRSFTTELDRLGIHARVISIPSRPFGSPRKRLQAYRRFLGNSETVLLGRIREFQFQVDHPRFGMGSEFSLLDMQDARIRVQVSMDLKFVNWRTGELLWKGSLSSDEEKKIHYRKRGQDLKAATELLSENLRKVILESVEKLTSSMR